MDQTAQALEALSHAVADQVRVAFRGAEPHDLQAAQQSVRDAGAAAMNAGASFTQLAEAEHAGDSRARAELEPDARKAVRRAGTKYRAGRDELTAAARQALALGLSRRQLAADADVSPAALRTLLTDIDADPGSQSEPAADAAEREEEIIERDRADHEGAATLDGEHALT